jgi:acetyl-CoA acyltransferase
MRDAVIVDAVRSPMGRGRAPRPGRAGGSLSGVHPVELLAQVFTGLLERSGIDSATVDDVIVGCVSQVGEQGYVPGRMAWLAAGFDENVPSVMVDRRCGSGQQAIDYAALMVTAGAAEVVVAAGVESMSRVPMGSARVGADAIGPSVTERYSPGLVTQGVSAELLARRFGLTRLDLDTYAAESHARAHAADDHAADEIVGIATPDGLVTADETVRAGTAVDDLAALAPAFRTAEAEERFPDLGWHVTAGNSSQIADGASAMLITSAERAQQLGLRARARFVGSAAVGDNPILMLSGPIPATQKLLGRTGLDVADIDHFEVNEAFACVPLAWQKHFGADPKLLNPLGGAIALGHPLGASGVRLMTTMLRGLEQSGGRYGLQTMCEAGGTANATVIEII